LSPAVTRPQAYCTCRIRRGHIGPEGDTRSSLYASAQLLHDVNCCTASVENGSGEHVLVQRESDDGGGRPPSLRARCGLQPVV